MTKSWQQSMLMLSLYFLNVFHQVVLATNSVSSKQQVMCGDDESSALFQFKQSFSIDKSASFEPSAYPKLASWKPNESGTINDCCSWDGVECSEDTGYVVGLDLSSSFLYGRINSSSSLFLLVHLRSLNLSDNQFMLSQIPSGISSLLQLTSLNLSFSGFSGQIPKEISQLTKLASLDLSRNTLQLQSLSFGHLVQSLKMLKELSLSLVNISSHLPHSLANLTSLRFLALEECGLTGEFPSSIFHLPELQVLSVGWNEKLTGYLPEFHTVSRLEHLRLAGTSFFGRLPVSIGNLKSLVALNLGNCFFSESLPASLGELTELTTLILGYNGFKGLSQLTSLNLSVSGFSGQIPKEISQLTQLASLDLSGNPLQLQSLSFDHLVLSLKMLKELYLSSVNISSRVPHSLANLTSLRFLVLEECGLTGELPSGIFHLPELQVLSVSLNEKLTGYLPEFHTESRLEHLGLAGTNFSGRLPVSIGNLKSLVTLDLGNCSFSESLPASLGNLTELTTLRLSDNRFKGHIPSLASLSELRTISLSNNEFDGGILPNWLGKLAKLTDVYLTNTNLYGMMPSSLSNLTQLAHIYLNSNHIYGQIPSWLMNLTQLTVVSFENNSLQGPIPATFSQLEHITDLGLYDNNLSGIVEADVFLNLKKLQSLQLSGINITFMDMKNYTNATLPQIQILGLNNCNLKVFPYFLRNQNELQFLSLSNNYFHGQIPEWFWNSSKEHWRRYF